MNPFLLSAIISYLLGSVPFGFLLVRIFRGEDIRRTGSGNIGATNVSRTSLGLGIITLLLDACKGFASVLIARHLLSGNTTIIALAAFFAVLGHVLPVWLKFRGGKGVATGLGAFILLAPKALLISIAVFIAVFALFRYVSLASISAVVLFPIAVYAIHPQRSLAIVLTVFTSALILLKHRANIVRLVAGSEPRFHAGHG